MKTLVCFPWGGEKSLVGEGYAFSAPFIFAGSASVPAPEQSTVRGE